LYVVRGTDEINTTIMQTKTGAFSLNSNDCYILNTPSHIFIWVGEGSNEFERKNSTECSQTALEDCQSKEHVVIKEGEEPDEFWNILGGKGTYTSIPKLKKGDINARLFQCTDKTGVFKVSEINNFTQDDLDNDDVMLLDIYDAVFVWIGKNSTKKEKEMAGQVSVDYIKHSDDGRNLDSPVYVVESGAEPLDFTVFFHGWDDEVARSGEDLYDRKLRQLNLESSVVGGLTSTKDHGQDPHEEMPKQETGAPEVSSGGMVIEFAKLKSKARPDGLDTGNLEIYLSDSEFEEVFKMNRAAFYECPKWKQLRLKKSAGLF